MGTAVKKTISLPPDLSKVLEEIAQEEEANHQRKGESPRPGSSAIFGQIVKVVSASKIFISALVFRMADLNTRCSRFWIAC
jgi:hypothetical protein